MASDPYAPTKALRHLDIVGAVREGRPVRPAHIHLVVSDACNQHCRYCAYRDPTYTSSRRFLPDDGSPPRRMMPLAKALEVLDDCVDMGCRAVQFTGGGEPTVHPDLRAMLAGCRDRDLSYAVVTNGVRAHPLVEHLARAAWVRVSLDTADSAIYSAIRGVSEWQHEAACSTVREVRDARDRLGTDCVLGVGCVVGPDNWRALPALVKLACSLGADNVSLAPQFSTAGVAIFDGVLDEVLASCEAAAALDEPSCRVYNRVPARIEDMRSGRPAFALCGYSFFVPYVAANLGVYRCCALAYNDAGLVGNIDGRRFRDLWIDQARADGMAAFDARTCDRCPYHAQGSLLEYVLSPKEPLHADFV